MRRRVIVASMKRFFRTEYSISVILENVHRHIHVGLQAFGGRTVSRKENPDLTLVGI